MTDRARRQPELLPGLRARVAGRRAKAAATGAGARPPGRAGRRSTRSPGSWSTCRWPTSTGPSTTRSPRRWPTQRRAGRPGEGPVRRPGRRRLRRGARRRDRPRRAGSPRCAAWSAPSRCSPPRSPRSAPTLAERYAGTRADVLRLAVPPRHATTEQQPSPPAPRTSTRDAAAGEAAWAGHDPGGGVPGVASPTGAARGPSGRPRRAPTGRVLVAHAAAATSPAGRGALVCVPDGKDVARVDAALTAVLGDGPPRRADRRRRARLAATATSSPSPGAPAGSWSAPARRASRPCTTSGWS